MADAFRQVFRSLRADPWFTFCALATFSLGIAVSTSAFSVLDRLVLRTPPGLSQPGELRRVQLTDLPSAVNPPGGPRSSLAPAEYVSVVRALQGIGSAAAYGNWPDALSLRVNGESFHARVLAVATNYFAVLGVRPAIGRFFSAPAAWSTGPGPAAEAVISEAFWTRALGRSQQALGETVYAFHQQLKIVGVTPAGFDGIGLDGPDIWFPADFEFAEQYGPQWLASRNGFPLAVVTRLPDPARIAEFQTLAQTRLAEDAKSDGSASRYGPVDLASLSAALSPDFHKEISLASTLWVVSIVVLLIAAINAGSLFLVRGLERQQRIAVLFALGATRARVLGVLLLEGIVLAVGGAALGALLARTGGRIIRTGIASYIHYTDVGFELRPFAYASIIALLAGGITAVLPGLRATRVDLRNLLDDNSPGSQRDIRRTSAIIHGVQVAFAVIVLYAAGLYMHSAQRARDVNIGMKVDNVLVATVDLASEGLNPAESQQFWNRVLQQIVGSGAVDAVALSSTLPFRSISSTRAFGDGAIGVPADSEAFVTSVTPGFTRALGIPVVRGRDFKAQDGPDVPVALINRTGARLLWAGADPLAHCVHVAKRSATCYRIVGVVEDSHRMALIEPPAIQLFFPLANPLERAQNYLIVRSRPGLLSDATLQVKQVLQHESPPTSQIDLGTLRADWERITGQWVRIGTLLTALAVLTVLITFVGLYGTLAYDILRRRREFGVRLALGARPVQLLKGVISMAVRWCSYGFLGGLAGAIWLAFAIKALLFATKPWDAVAFGVAAVLTLLIGVAAAWLGARRAAIRDPAFLLRISR